MKKALFVLFAVMLVVSACFAEEAETQVKTITFIGRFEFVSSGSDTGSANPYIAVRNDAGHRTSFMVTSDTVITGKDDKPVSLNWITKDDKVHIEYVPAENNIKLAKSIKVLKGW